LLLTSLSLFFTIVSGITKYYIQKAPGISTAKGTDFCTSMAIFIHPILFSTAGGARHLNELVFVCVCACVFCPHSRIFKLIRLHKE